MVRLIKKLREYGFIIEMDDFGSGYSSLNLLKGLIHLHLPLFYSAVKAMNTERITAVTILNHDF